MSLFSSPIVRCEAVHSMVFTEQTQGQCAQNHGCPPGRDCPLGGRFANVQAARRNPSNCAGATRESRYCSR